MTRQAPKKPTPTIALAGRAVLAQMQRGPWPVTALPAVWAWLERKRFVRRSPALQGHPEGWMITGAGHDELVRFALATPDTVAAPAPEPLRGASIAALVDAVERTR